MMNEYYYYYYYKVDSATNDIVINNFTNIQVLKMFHRYSTKQVWFIHGWQVKTAGSPCHTGHIRVL